MKINILVFPCGSEIGLEIFRSLRYSTHFNLYGGSSVNDHGKFVYQHYIGDIPFVDEPRFIEKLNSTIKKYKIKFIFPAHDDVLLKLAQAKADGQLACELITSELKTCKITRSKNETYTFFEGIIPTPKIYLNINDILKTDLPIFMKPDIGQGSKGTYLASTFGEIDFYLKRDPSLLMLEYLPGKMYTVECFTNKSGNLMFCKGRERIRVLNGISVSSKIVFDDRFSEMADKINQKLRFRGVWFFQLKENQIGGLVLMEIAPRIAGTMAVSRARGVNLALLSLFDALDQKVVVIENENEMVIDRALDNTYKHDIKYDHVYLDFDDVVVIDGKVNALIMAFVFQCLNKGVSIHLITRHKDDLERNLRKFKLSGIFDEIIWLKKDENKAFHIVEKDAIFIDDSFAERKKVHDARGIPTFDSHMIESLMEKF